MIVWYLSLMEGFLEVEGFLIKMNSRIAEAVRIKNDADGGDQFSFSRINIWQNEDLCVLFAIGISKPYIIK